MSKSIKKTPKNDTEHCSKFEKAAAKKPRPRFQNPEKSWFDIKRVDGGHALQMYYYDLLEKSGFQDIEQSHFDCDLPLTPDKIANNLQDIDPDFLFEHITSSSNYFSAVSEFVRNEENLAKSFRAKVVITTKLERQILKLHSLGLSNAEIITRLNDPKIYPNKIKKVLDKFNKQILQIALRNSKEE